jgi:hypothetical protein
VLLVLVLTLGPMLRLLSALTWDLLCLTSFGNDLMMALYMASASSSSSSQEQQHISIGTAIACRTEDGGD